MTLKHSFTTLSLAAALVLTATGCGGGGGGGGNVDNGGGTTPAFTQVKDLPSAEKTATIQAALSAYADYALKSYTDAKNDAMSMKSAIDTFVVTPTDENLAAAKTAWLKARESYGVTEIFRLSNGPIDAEVGYAASWDAPEGQLNAWPLDESMIDYTTDANNAQTSPNIIDTTGTFTPNGGTDVNVTDITPEVLAQLNENGGDANVATGYHAVEFLLWGQDQDYASFVADNITHGELTAGQRPLTDYTSDTHAQRRKDYLVAAVQLIIEDLDKMVAAWNTTEDNYRKALLGTHPVAVNNIDQSTALKQIMGGMGIFLKSELANERMAVAALTPSEEDEHSCFSDNTHRDIDLNYIGFKNALAIFAAKLSPAQQQTIASLEASIDAKVKSINDTANSTFHFDYQIVEANGKLQTIVTAKNEMRDLGDEMINVAAEYGVTLSDSDVTDPEETAL